MARKTTGKKAKGCSQVGISTLNTEKLTPGQRAKGSGAASEGASGAPAEAPASTRSLRGSAEASAGGQQARERTRTPRRGGGHQAFPGCFQAPPHFYLVRREPQAHWSRGEHGPMYILTRLPWLRTVLRIKGKGWWAEAEPRDEGLRRADAGVVSRGRALGTSSRDGPTDQRQSQVHSKTG